MSELTQIVGRVIPIHRGDFDEGTQYVSLDEVIYQGSSYRTNLNTTIPVGTLPTNTDYWTKIASNGLNAEVTNITSQNNGNGTFDLNFYFNNDTTKTITTPDLTGDTGVSITSIYLVAHVNGALTIRFSKDDDSYVDIVTPDLTGPTGPPPILTVGTVTSLSPVSQPTFELVPDGNGGYTVNVGLTKGQTGDGDVTKPAVNVEVGEILASANLQGNILQGTGKKISDLAEASQVDSIQSKLDGIEAGAQANTVDSVAGKTGEVTLVKADVGLGNVDNTADNTKMVYGFLVWDSRDIVSAPNQVIDKTGLFEFKRNTSVGNPPSPSTATYSHVMTVNGWTADGTGGWPTQVSFGENLSFRKGVAPDTWGDWNSLWHSGNLDLANYATAKQGLRADSSFDPADLLESPPVIDFNFTSPDAVPSSMFGRTTGGGYYDGNKIYKTAGSNVLRITHDPLTGVKQGVLLESYASANLIFPSANTYATGVDVDIEFGQANGIMGDTTLAKISSTVASGVNTSYVNSVITVPNDTWTRTYSAYLKEGTSPVTTLNLFYTGGTFVQVVGTVNWSTKTFSTSGGSGFLEHIKDDLYRAQVSLANNGTGNTQAVCRLYSRDTSNDHVVGEYVYGGDQQLEVGLFASSYINTTTESVARAADILPVSLININLSSGTIYFEAMATFGQSAIMLANLDNGALNQLGTFRLIVTPGGEALYYQPPSGGEITIGRSGGGIDITKPVRAAFTWSGTSLKSSINGLEPISGTLSEAVSNFNFARLLLGNGSWFLKPSAILARTFLSQQNVDESTLQEMTA